MNPSHKNSRELLSPLLLGGNARIDIYRFPELIARCNNLLDGRTSKQIKHLAKTAEWLISDYFEQEIQAWVHEQGERNFPIIEELEKCNIIDAGYQDFVEKPTKEDLYEMIENHVFYDEFKVIIFGSTSTLTALETALYYRNMDDDFIKDARPYEFAAALALEKIEHLIEEVDNIQTFEVNMFWTEAEAITNDKHKPTSASTQHICDEGIELLANNLIDITEAICRAEALKQIGELDSNYSNAVEEAAKERISLQSRNAATKRHRETNKIKADMLEEWEREKHHYTGASDFANIRARDYGLIVRTCRDWIYNYENNKKR